MYRINKTAFTMIELIFVIVVLGILAAVAVPKFAATRLDAQIAKGRADVSAIRSAIVSERQTRLIRGNSGWINVLHDTSQAAVYFDNNGTATNSLLMYGVTAEEKDGHWHGYAAGATAGTHQYDFRLEGNDNVFTYNSTNAVVTIGAGANAVDVPAGGLVCTSGTRCSDLTD